MMNPLQKAKRTITTILAFSNLKHVQMWWSFLELLELLKAIWLTVKTKVYMSIHSTPCVRLNSQ